MAVHQNSIEAKRKLKVHGKHNRILQVFHIAKRPLTDREVKTLGKFDDMNEVRPRITELLSFKYGRRLLEIEGIRDPITKKFVRRTKLIDYSNPSQHELF